MSENRSMFNKAKWFPLVALPFRISHLCCSEMKKKPVHAYQREHGYVPIIGTMATESRLRKQAWIRHGCNAFEGKKSRSQPMSFWTEQDVLRYIEFYRIEIPSVYGDIVYKDKDGYAVKAPSYDMIPAKAKLETTGMERTGCMYCAFGLASERGETRFQMLKRTHPKQYDYCMNGGQWIDNPDYIPDCPEYDGDWKNWNPEKIWVPSKEGLGMRVMFRMANEAMGSEVFRVD